MSRDADRRAATSAGPRVLRNLPAYRQIVAARCYAAVVYRHHTFFLFAVVLLQIFVLRRVWTALYAAQPDVEDMPLHTLLVYLTLANLQNWVMQDPTVSQYMYTRIREGQVAFDLMRPAGFVPQVFAHLAGSSLASTAVAVLALVPAAVVGAVGAPAGWSALGAYLLSLVLGYLITALLTLLIGMLGFWTLETAGFTMLYRLVNQFFAGALVPIAFFPAPLRIVSDLLPFQATTYTPVALYLGQTTGAAAVSAILVQLVWCALLSLAAWAIWRRAVRRIVIQGG
jgi:ABC-2 type transport system permease protein